MNKALIVHSSKNNSNTNKMVEYISSNIDIMMVNISDEVNINFNDFNDIVFCSGIYYGEISSSIKEWIDDNSADLIGKNLFFMISSAILSVDYYKPINRFLEDKDLILKDIFHCKGYSENSPWDFSRQVGKEHPNSDDLENALFFIKEKLNIK